MSNRNKEINMLLDDARWDKAEAVSERLSRIIAAHRGEAHDPNNPTYGVSRVITDTILRAMPLLEGEQDDYEPPNIARSPMHSLYCSTEVRDRITQSRERISAKLNRRVDYAWMARTAIDFCLNDLEAAVSNEPSVVPIIRRGRRKKEIAG